MNRGISSSLSCSPACRWPPHAYVEQASRSATSSEKKVSHRISVAAWRRACVDGFPGRPGKLQAGGQYFAPPPPELPLSPCRTCHGGCAKGGWTLGDRDALEMVEPRDSNPLLAKP